MSEDRVAKVYRCKFCHVRVISKTDTRPILGQEHGKHCRRRNGS